jgi:hypothetical protein
MPQGRFLPFLISFGTKQSHELKLKQLDTPPILSSTWNCPQRHHLTIGFGVALPWSPFSVTEN